MFNNTIIVCATRMILYLMLVMSYLDFDNDIFVIKLMANNIFHKLSNQVKL